MTKSLGFRFHTNASMSVLNIAGELGLAHTAAMFKDGDSIAPFVIKPALRHLYTHPAAICQAPVDAAVLPLQPDLSNL
jgi:hypothetical protein